MILAKNGLQGVSLWQLLFYCDMRSGDGRLQNHQSFRQKKKIISHLRIFRQKKKG
jgi:hypothetical protein